jgi:kexin
VVDANAAVALARTITPVGPELTYESSVSSPALAIPDNDTTGASTPISVTGSGIGHVEVIEVELTIAHPRTADLEITLQKSGGASDVLYALHGCVDPETFDPAPCSDIDAFVFTSVRHLDEPADGLWTLVVKDRRSANVGSITRWQLRIFGRQ